MQRTNWLCEDCDKEGRVIPANVVDHIKPLALGGSDRDENTRNLCKAHHAKRTAEQFGHKSKVSIGVDGWPQ
jgi:5-methylcytosine-specific restriction protein A